eukprot:Gb_29341 [translate_table: standard]
MDWQGQKLAELLMQIVLALSAFVAFITGYLMASYKLMLMIYTGGVLITLLVSVPNWPFFNQHPLQWLDPKKAETLNSRDQKVTSLPGKKPGKSVRK